MNRRRKLVNEDPVVAEVRAARARLWAKAGRSLEGLFARAERARRQFESGRTKAKKRRRTA